MTDHPWRNLVKRVDAWIDSEFDGHGIALDPDRRRDPDEPLMSMRIAKALTRRAVLEFMSETRK